MRINNNIAALNTKNQLGKVSNRLGKTMKRLSSGMRINSAADDAAGLAISEKLRGQIRGAGAAVRSAQDGMGRIQVAEGALTEVSSMLVRMKELGTQKLSYSAGSDEEAAINTEMDQLGTQIDDIITNTAFNGDNVFTTDITIVSDTSGGTTTYTATGTANQTLSGASTLADIDNSIQSINSDRATFGAYSNRLDVTVNNLQSTSENLQAAESRVRDADMAAEMVSFTKDSIIQQAAQSMLAQANQMPQGVIGLLQ